jgi:hypothetical protein
MPKSKKRKGRYIPKSPQQQTMAATAQGNQTAAPAMPRPAAPTARATVSPSRSGPSGPKMPVMPQVNVSAELKVIGIITVAIFAVIFALYFILR